VEGMNILGIMLGYLCVLVLGITSLVALGLRIAGRTRGALLTFAGGLLGTVVIAALAILSDLEWGGRQVYLSERCREAVDVTVALSLLLAGAGQFIAALRIRASYGVAFGWGAGSMVLLVVSLLGAESVRGVHYQIVAGVNLKLVLSLLLAALCLLSAVVSPRKKTAALFCTALGGFGFVAGFAVADACVTTRCTPCSGAWGGRRGDRPGHPAPGRPRPPRSALPGRPRPRPLWVGGCPPATYCSLSESRVSRRNAATECE
jgi:hypothetical protein